MSGKLVKIALFSFFFFGALLLTAQEVLLSDDFSSNKNDWYENESVKVINGRYEFNDKEIAEYTWMNDTMEDGSLEADSIWLGGDGSMGYGLLFRLSDAKNFYFLWITGEGNYTVGKVVTDQAVPIKGWTYSEAIEKAGENHLRRIRLLHPPGSPCGL